MEYACPTGASCTITSSSKVVASASSGGKAVALYGAWRMIHSCASWRPFSCKAKVMVASRKAWQCYVQGTNAAEVCLCCCLKKEDKRRVRRRLGELGHFVQTFFWTSTLYLTPSSHLQWPCALAWAVIEMCKLKLEPCVARSGSVTSLLLFNPFKPNPPSTCVLTAVSHCSVSDEGHY